MFGLSFKDKTIKVLKNDMQYANIHPVVQLPVLIGIIVQVKALNQNKYDAAITFMLVQMNSMVEPDDRLEGFLVEPDDQLERFINEQSFYIRRLEPLATIPSSDIYNALESLKLKFNFN